MAKQNDKLPLRAADGTDVTEVVRQVYDMATNSMDHGSGFLSTEEYEALALLAGILDASDRLDVEAEARSARYPWWQNGSEHKFEPDRPERHALCLVCGKDERSFPYLHPSEEPLPEIVQQQIAVDLAVNAPEANYPPLVGKILEEMF